MNRWLLVAGFLILVGLLGALLVVVVGLATRGITIQVAQPLAIADPVRITGSITVQGPIEVSVDRLALDMSQPIAVQIPSEPVEVRASLGQLACPQCGGGVLLPVRWNLLTGEIVWRCTACGRP